jgi:PAS domain S-box-containing protein
MSETIVMRKEGFGILTKLLSGFILIVVLNGIGDYYSFTQMNRLYDLTTKIFYHPLQVTRAILSADTNIVKIHRSMKDVALSSTPIEIETAIGFVKDYEKNVYEHLGLVEKWILGDEGATLLAETVNLFRDWKPIRDEVAALTQAGKRTQAFALTKGKGAKHVELLNSKMEELKNYAASKALGMLSDSEKTKEAIFKYTSIIFLVVVIFSGLFGFLLSRAITDSINRLIKGVVEFGQGNLDYKVEVKFKDEINWLANALNNMAAQRKKVHEELNLQSEIMANMAEGVYLINAENGEIVYANPKLEEMFGYAPNEMVGMHVSVVNAPTEKNPEQIAEEIMKELNENGIWSGEVNNIRKDGSYFWCYANVSKFDHSRYGKVLISVHTDITIRKHFEKELLEYRLNLEKTVEERTSDLEKEITERKQVEKELFENQEILQRAIEGAKIAVWDRDLVNNSVFWSKNSEQVLGFSKDAFKDNFESHMKWIHPDDIESVNEGMVEAMKDHALYESEYRVVLPGGDVRWISAPGKIIRDSSGQPIRIVGTMMDVTDQKLATQMLSFQASLLEQVHNAVITIDLNNTILSWNTFAEVLYQWTSEEAIGKNIIELLAPEELKESTMTNFEKLNKNGHWEGDYDVKRKDGTTIPAHIINTYLKDINGENIGFIGISMDITEQKKSREELKKYYDHLEDLVEERTTELKKEIAERVLAEKFVRDQAKLLDLIFAHSLDSIVLLDKEYNFIRVSETYAKSCQRTSSEFPGHNHFEFHPSNLKDEFDDIKKRKIIYQQHARPFIFPDHPEWGTSYWDLGLVPILDDEEGEVELFLFTLMDVTESKKADEALKESEEKYRTTFDVEIDALVLTDVETGKILDVNQSFLDLYGYQKNEVLVMIDTDFSAEPEKTQKAMLKPKVTIPLEWHKKKDGTVFPVEISTAVFSYQGRDVNIGAIRDITERKQVEEQIKASLIEKESLLHEIHHRVKNNLALISSLLGLQVNSVNDELSKGALLDSRNRVLSMSIIHETLYQSEDLSSIDMNTYLSKLVMPIAQNYTISRKVKVKINVENTIIGVKQASSVGLIVNELITNSFKYAFPDIGQ